MKIHQLPDGARFEYEGAEYVKTGPMFAAGKDGQRLIPKYAVLKPLDSVPASTAPQRADAVSRTRVLEAFGAFYDTCYAWVPPEKQGEMAACRNLFLTQLD